MRHVKPFRLALIWTLFCAALFVFDIEDTISRSNSMDVSTFHHGKGWEINGLYGKTHDSIRERNLSVLFGTWPRIYFMGLCAVLIFEAFIWKMRI